MPTLLIVLGLGLGALLLMQASASASTSSTNAWPPSQAVQQALIDQMSAMASGALGRPLTAQEATNIGNGIAQAPAEYVSTLAGATPTVAGYQAWVLSQLYQAMMAAAQAASVSQSIVQQTG